MKQQLWNPKFIGQCLQGVKDEGGFSKSGQNPPSLPFLSREWEEGERAKEVLSQMAKSGSDISSFGVREEGSKEGDRARLNWSTDVSLKWRWYRRTEKACLQVA